ncbi:MAG TPA: FtsH protease activity modulator HflK [Myxococcota bacterium]|nr:FtsH protease activity modulator HflK [Myxococcota bacterium]
MALARRHRRTVALVAAAVVALILVGSAIYTVQPSEEVVITRFGRYDRTSGPGLHFKWPLGIEDATTVKSKLVLQDEFGFRSAEIKARGTTYQDRNFAKESQMLTGDLNVADVEWIVQYQISDPKKYLFHAQDPHQNIRDVAEAIMRRVVGDRTVNEVLTTGRVAIGVDAQRLMQEVLDRYDLGIRIVTVKLQDVNPPEVVKPSFNEVNAAKQEQEQAINNAEEAYNKLIPEARGKAEETISEADGYASAVVNRAEGDAERFDLTLRAYRTAPDITRRRLYIETMQGIYERLQRVTLVDPSVKGMLPVFTPTGNSEEKRP